MLVPLLLQKREEPVGPDGPTEEPRLDGGGGASAPLSACIGEVSHIGSFMRQPSGPIRDVVRVRDPRVPRYRLQPAGVA